VSTARVVAGKSDFGDDVGAFSDWQSRYSERGVPTFPVIIAGRNKKPAISNYMKVGHPASRQLALKFTDVDALGFMLGQRSGITVLDIDTPDERFLVDALDLHGKSPVIILSGSGNRQVWYKHNGETREIRPLANRPIDILGDGFVVAPPSRGTKADYRFIQGGLDDLANLPTMLHTPSIVPAAVRSTQRIGIGNRNDELFRACMRQARHCDDLESLIDVARTRNANYHPPLHDGEVIKIATSAWGYEERGENRFGQTGAWLRQPHVNALVRDPALCALILWLKAANGRHAKFLIADGLCAPKYLDWPIGRLREARRRAIKTGWVVKVRHEARGAAALYCWGPTSWGEGAVFVEDSLSNS
jgi:Bifunctional DNA primase/polymerase, N-terminal/Primase C terminal 1 (PriCT-1)